jgi:hypothetical protein
MPKDYNSISFKNKDIDKFSTRFGNGNSSTSDPGKGTVPVSRKQVRRSSRDLNKNLNEGIEKQGKVKQYYTQTPVQGKTRLESKMEKYGVEPASSKLSPSQQKEFNKNRVKLAQQKEKAEKRQERNANPTKFDTFVMKTLGTGKYDKGGKKNMDMGGNRSKVCVDKAGQKSQDAGCAISMEGKFKKAFKKQKPVQNTMWTITK